MGHQHSINMHLLSASHCAKCWGHRYKKDSPALKKLTFQQGDTISSHTGVYSGLTVPSAPSYTSHRSVSRSVPLLSPLLFLSSISPHLPGCQAWLAVSVYSDWGHLFLTGLGYLCLFLSSIKTGLSPRGTVPPPAVG